MLKKIVEDEKGIAVADALIAVLIMTIFLSLVTTLCYNIYITASFTKRNSEATDYGIKIIEYIDKNDYDEITYDNIKVYINNTLDAGNSKVSAETEENESTLTTPYKVIIAIEKYNELEENKDKMDLIKTVKIKIKYSLGDSEKILNFERVKQK